MNSFQSSILLNALRSGLKVIVVRVAEVKGSTPRDSDALMLVGQTTVSGTIGGGVLEWTAIEHAREMLATGKAVARLALPLGPYLGQCCGGHVTLEFFEGDWAFADRLREQEQNECSALPRVMVIGAGHVGRAIAHALSPLPFSVTIVDPRADELSKLPHGVMGEITEDPVLNISSAPLGTSFIILSHSHTIDFLATEAALTRPDAQYVGMIGSATKLARFKSWLRSRGESEVLAKRLVCPIGGAKIRDKRPEVIAALVAAELLVKVHCGLDTQSELWPASVDESVGHWRQ